MAVAYETSLAPQAVTFAAAGEAETVAFDAGTGSNRVLLVCVGWRDRSNTITSVTYGGAPMTSAGARVNNGSLNAQLFSLANPASGSNNIVVTMGASAGGDSAALISAWVGNSADITGTPVDGYASGNGTGSTANMVSSVTVSSATGDRAVVFHNLYDVAATRTATPTNYTERQDAGASAVNMEFGDADGAASVATDATWSNAASTVYWVALGININAAVASAPRPKFLAARRRRES